ncbi:MAG: zf-HC2 domain-containing protein [Kofleriaceae bacterium]|nr:zf-HC2 domain-containing protein [Kofleriaceae bacterium]
MTLDNTALLCHSIDTLAMAYLDHELAPEEQRELELHMHACKACEAHVGSERLQLQGLRSALAAPPASDLFRAAMVRSLDATDQAAQRHARSASWQRWMLPGAAMAVAAAALLFFFANRPVEQDTALAQDAVRQQLRPAPLEVSGPATTPWLREHFESSVAPPSFARATLIGARLTSVAGRDAAQLFYEVRGEGTARFQLTAFVVQGVTGTDLPPGQDVKANRHLLRVSVAAGYPSVSFVEGGAAYIFVARDLSLDALLDVVTAADLVRRAPAGE